MLLSIAGVAWAQPDYDRDNPIATLTARAKGAPLAGGAAMYDRDSLHYLAPLVSFGLPSEDSSIAHDGRASTQEALRRYTLGDYYVVKGHLRFGGTPRNFLKIGYAPAPGSAERVPLTLEIEAGAVSRRVAMPYHAATAEYAAEFWAIAPSDASALGPQARAAIEQGRIIADASFPPGNPLDYQPSRIRTTAWEAGDAADINHPLRPARLRLAIRGPSGVLAGPHVLAYKMIRRGFDAFRSDRWSQNPHGGTGSTESILFYNADSNDPDHILRTVGAGRPLASGAAAREETVERFFTAKYMQYVRFGPGASIGIHRHKDFMDAFWVTRGSGMGVVADAVALDGTERTVELRRLRAFEGMIVRPGQMHGILRDSEEPLEMFAFGAAN